MHLLITMWGCIQCFHNFGKKMDHDHVVSSSNYHYQGLEPTFKKDIASNIKIVKYLVMHARQCISFAQFFPSSILHLEKKELKMPHPRT
jgi:hypothetical protein